MKKDTQLKIIQRLLTGDCGLSAKHMIAVACGLHQNGCHPVDASDFARCARLVESIPEIKSHFPEIARTSIEWEIIIRHWDYLVKIYPEPGAIFKKFKDWGIR